MVAGRMSGTFSAQESALHGLTAWGLSSTFAVYALSTAVGTMVSGVLGFTQNVNVGTPTPEQAQAALQQAGAVLTGAGWTGFFWLLLTGIAAYLGGLSGSPRMLRIPTYRKEEEPVGTRR
jgi:hypothetical protein